MNKKFDVIIVGELNVDLILNGIENTLQIGKEIFSRNMTLTLGSSSAIFANNLSRLGSKVTFIGRIGKDSFADVVTSSLAKSGVNINNLITSAENQTGITVALSYGEDRAMVTYPGAMSDLTQDDIKDEDLHKAQHLHVSSIFLQEGLLPNVHLLFQRAKSLGLTTSLDPQWDPHENWNVDLKALLPYVDIFLPNEIELKNIASADTVEKAVQNIKSFSNHIVVKRGIKGAILFYKNNQIEIPAFLNKEVVDTIGAGDSFNAGFIHAFIQKRSLEDCMKMGTIAGAINTTAAGGTKAFENIEQIKNIAKKHFNYVFNNNAIA